MAFSLEAASHHPPRAGSPRTTSTIAGILLLTLLAGCTSTREYLANGFKVGPNYCRPAAPVSQEWIDAEQAHLDTSRAGDPEWWRTFNDPVLDVLVATAYEENLTLRVAGLRILEARAQRGIAAGNLLPQQQQATGDYTRTGTSGNSRFGALFSSEYDAWTVGGNLAWELDFWGRFRRAVEAADANLDASVESYDDVLVLLISEVAQTYANIRIAEERLVYARENVRIQQKNLTIAEHRFREGTVTRLDVTQGESDLANTEAAIYELETARRQAINQLCILLAMPPHNLDEILKESKGVPKAPAQVAVGIPADLLRRRPDVRQAERQVAAQSAMIGVATAELYPHFAIGGAIQLEAINFTDLFKASSVAGSVGPSFSWNILNYGRLVNDIRVQDARFQQLAVQYQETVLKANAEAENAIIGFLNAQQRLLAVARSADAAGQSVEIVMAQYREGAVDFNRVSIVQQSLTQQQDQLAVAEGAVAQNLIELYRALGGGWQIRLNAPTPLPPVAAGQPGQPAQPAQPGQPAQPTQAAPPQDPGYEGAPMQAPRPPL